MHLRGRSFLALRHEGSSDMKGMQNRASAPEEILLFLSRPSMRWPLVRRPENPMVAQRRRPAARLGPAARQSKIDTTPPLPTFCTKMGLDQMDIQCYSCPCTIDLNPAGRAPRPHEP